MAKLYIEATSDKGGRVVGKGGNEYVTITVRNSNINIFDITIKDDGHKRGKLEIMSYATGRDGIQTIEYM